MEEENNVQTEQEEMVDRKKQSLFSRLRQRKEARKQKRQKAAEEQLSAEETKQIEERLEVVNQEIEEIQSPKKRKKSIIFWVFNLILIIGILIWNILSTDDFTPFEMLRLDYSYILVAFLLMLGMILTDVLSVHRMIYRKTARSRWATSYKSVAIYRFTPLSTGGQPFMISYLNGRDIPPATSLSIPMTKLLFQDLAWLTLTSACLIYSFTKKIRTIISALSIIGFIITLVVVVVIICFSISKKIGSRMIGWFVRVMTFLHIWKDYDKHYERLVGSLEDFQAVMRSYNKEFFEVIYQYILSLARIFMMYCLPFFIYSAFKGYNTDMFGEFFIYTALIDLASHVIPLPAGTGINEITFTWLFATYLGGSTFWALLLWRFFTFYFYLLQGVGVIAYDTFYGNRKYRWIQKKRALQEESREFRREQIENFRLEREKRRRRQKKV